MEPTTEKAREYSARRNNRKALNVLTAVVETWVGKMRDGLGRLNAALDKFEPRVTRNEGEVARLGLSVSDLLERVEALESASAEAKSEA